MTETLGYEAWSRRLSGLSSLLGPRELKIDSWVLKHALVSKVRRLSRKYFTARLEVMESFSEPGPTQFIMIWIPGIDCLPMSVARYRGDGVIEVFFDVRGEGTLELSRSEGRLVGIIGPLGKPLRLNEGRDYLLVAGGSGLAVIVRIAEVLNRLGVKPTVVWGVKSGGDVGMVLEHFSDVFEDNLIVCSEDCGVGECGLASEVALRVARALNCGELEVIAAGPNRMLHAVASSFRSLGVDPVVVTESMVKCGMGLCGECIIGRGYRLCRDGPAFRASEIMDYLRRG